MTVVMQFAGRDKWEAELWSCEMILHTWKWSGQYNYKLETFLSKHQNTYVTMTMCTQHVDYQLTNKHSHVKYILDTIKSSDAQLQAAMTSIHQDNGANGLRRDFERLVAHLLLSCPIARKKHKKPNAINDIAAVDGKKNKFDNNTANVSAFGAKVGKGAKTGVHLQYHTKVGYKKLATEEKNKLCQWREENENKEKSSKAL